MTVIHQLSLVLHDKIPLLILINFILLIVLIILNWNYIKKLFIEIDKKTWCILIIIFFIALLTRMFIPPHQHIMYIDEPWYMEAGKDMLQTGHQGLYPKSIGWPFILGIAFILKISNFTALYTSTMLGALTVFNIFFLAFLITKHKNIGLAASLIFSLFAAHIRWSASAETNVASLFFITLTLFFCFLYYRNKKISLLWLSLISLAFTVQFRPENYVLPVLFLFGCILFNKKFFSRINFKFIFPWFILIILPFADFIQILDFYTSTNWTELHTANESTGKNFGINNFNYNSSMYGKYFINTEFQPILFTFLSLIGLAYMFYKQKKEAFFLIAWFCFLLFNYSFSFPFIGGSTEVLAKTRFFMSFYPITVIFMGYGILLIKNITPDNIKKIPVKTYIFPLLTLLTSVLFIPYSIQASSMFSGDVHKLETKIPELAEKDIPSDCTIVANWPTVLKSTTDLNVINIDNFLNQEDPTRENFNDADCVLFFEDLYCLNFKGVFQEKCLRIKKYYKLEEYKAYSEKDINYTFYRIVGFNENEKRQ